MAEISDNSHADRHTQRQTEGQFLSISSGLSQYVWKPFILYLLGNSPHPASTTPQLPQGDQRLQFVQKELDPRIHFALVCGAKVRWIYDDCDFHLIVQCHTEHEFLVKIERMLKKNISGSFNSNRIIGNIKFPLVAHGHAFGHNLWYGHACACHGEP